jgi:hypothetical protein
MAGTGRVWNIRPCADSYVGQVFNLQADLQSARNAGLQTRAQDTMLPHMISWCRW